MRTLRQIDSCKNNFLIGSISSS